MSIITKWLLAPLSLLASCATAGGYRIADHVTVSDDPASARFVLHYQNDTHHMICLSFATWPNESGNLPLTDPPDVWVTVGQKKFPLDTFVEDCERCSVRVKRKSRVTGYLNYSAFKLPDALAHEHKELHITVGGGPCH